MPHTELERVGLAILVARQNPRDAIALVHFQQDDLIVGRGPEAAREGQVDAIGNDMAGVRHPFVAVPEATLTGWNTRTPEFGGDDLCDLLGSMIPLPRTAAAAKANHDPRPGLDQLYKDRADYVRKVTEAVQELQRQRLILPEDAEVIIREAQQMSVME